MSRVKTHATKLELVVRKLIKGLGYKIKTNVANLPGKPDIVLVNLNKAVFVNGCFWHGHKNCKRSKLPDSNRKFWVDKISGNKLRDKRNFKKMNDLGWEYLVLWQCQMMDEKGLIRKIRAFIKGCWS